MEPSVRSRAGIADLSRPALLALLAVTCAAGPARAQGSAVDQQIAFLELRVSRDAADPITPTHLGHAYLRKAKAEGAFAAYRRAEAAFRLALERSPGHFGALTGLAAALSARHAFAEALAIAEEAIQADPQSADAYAAAGDAALEAGQLEKADALYARVAELATGYHAETRRANLAAARGDSAAAYAALDRAAADATTRGMAADLVAWAHLRAGGIAWDHGDWPRAERSYLAAQALTPTSYLVVEHLAELRAAQGRDDEALALYREALALSDQPEFRQAVGAIHARGGRTADAAQAYAQARAGFEAASGAGDPGAYRPLALFLVDVAKAPADAVRWARADAAIRQDGVTLGVLAWTLLKAGMGEEAAAVAVRAVAARPVDAETWYRAGVVAMERGDTAAAQSRLARAMAINPRGADAADAWRRLEKLSGDRR